MEDLYKIEIWRYHSIEATYESNDINEVVKWYREEWQYAYEWGECSFSVFKNR